MKNMKVGILGSGYIAEKMAEAINGLESREMGVQAYAIASRSLEKAEAFAQKHGFQKTYGSYEALAQDPNIDLVYIATPHSHHFECAKLCIEHNKNLLIEKPFCANSKQANIIISMAHEKGTFLCEAMWTRFLPAVQIIHNWIISGLIGIVKGVEADFSQPLTHVERLINKALAGGALLDLGIYSLTFADLFLGTDNPIVKIDSQSIKYHTGVDATDWINILYKNGQYAYLKTSITSKWHNEGKIYGSKGFIRVVNLNDMEKIELYDIAGNIVEEINPPRIVNCYEYEILACKKALENPNEFKHEIYGIKQNTHIPLGINNTNAKISTIWECPEMPHTKTLDMLEIMDCLRANWGVNYPFEISPSDTWNREGNQSILQIFNIETEKTQVIKEFNKVIEAPNWSADGSFITFNSNGRIYMLKLVYDEIGSITAGDISEIPSYYVDNCNNDHVLSPDGTGVYVSHHTKEDGLSRIYKIFFDGRMPELVTPLAPSYLHGITPDGNKLVYCAERNSEYNIYTIPSCGGNETRLTTAKGLNDGPEYDKNGKYIWFNSVRTGRMQAWRMKADGTEQTQITDDPHWNTWFPHISPDLKHIVMLAYHESDVRPSEHVPNKNVELRLASSDTDFSESKTILKLFGGQGTINVNSWAPDSKHFAFVSYKK